MAETPMLELRDAARYFDVSRPALQRLIAGEGKRILILAGTPFGAPGAANLLRLAHVPMKGRGHKG